MGCKETWMEIGDYLRCSCTNINERLGWGWEQWKRWKCLYSTHTLQVELKCDVSRLVVEFSSVAQPYPTLCDPMNHSTPGLRVHDQLWEFTKTHLHWVGDAIQPSLPLSTPSPPALNLSQHQGLFKWVSSSHEVVKVLEFQLHHQSFQWTRRTDF